MKKGTTDVADAIHASSKTLEPKQVRVFVYIIYIYIYIPGYLTAIGRLSGNAQSGVVGQNGQSGQSGDAPIGQGTIDAQSGVVGQNGPIGRCSLWGPRHKTGQSGVDVDSRPESWGGFVNRGEDLLTKTKKPCI